jgi:DNA invertase Pin-like site-specific DNA recombinase
LVEELLESLREPLQLLLIGVGEEVMALSDRLVDGLGLPRYSASQRGLFFRLLDRGGTIRAAAVGAGVSPDTGYRWRRQAGVAARRQRPRTYTAEEKAEFFRLLHIRGNVSAVARELGYVRVTCYKWAHQAGIFTGKDVSDERQEFLRLRSEGVSRREAAEQVGVDKRTAQDWDKGIRQFYGGRVYPDGRVVKYRPAEILANVKNPRNNYGHNDNRGTLERLEPERVYRDKLSGTSTREQRPGLAALLDYARPGDAIVVVGIDRLGRNAAEVMTTIRELRDREIVLRSLREGIDTSNATDRMVAGVLASLAELELELGRERRAAAREARRARGQAIGRPKALDASKAALARRMHSSGEPVSTIANTLAVSRATVYRVLAEADETDRNQGKADS